LAIFIHCFVVSVGYIEDSDEEYDPDLDDFIDDGPAESEDVSKHIREIFGYDKSR
jgi:protein SPT2